MDIKTFRLTHIINGLPNDIIIEYYKDIDNIPIFISKNIDTFNVTYVNKVGNIIVISEKIINDVNEDLIKCITWYLIINISFKMHEYEYEKSRDLIIDTYVGSLFGHTNMLSLLEYILEHIELDKEQKDIIEYRINNIKNALLNNKVYIINKKEILINAELAFVNLEEDLDEKTC